MLLYFSTAFNSELPEYLEVPGLPKQFALLTHTHSIAGEAQVTAGPQYKIWLAAHQRELQFSGQS